MIGKCAVRGRVDLHAPGRRHEHWTLGSPFVGRAVTLATNVWVPVVLVRWGLQRCGAACIPRIRTLEEEVAEIAGGGFGLDVKS